MSDELLDYAKAKIGSNEPLPDDVPPTVWTIGYGNKPFSMILAALDAYGIDALVDCRCRPYSRNPEFNTNRLKAALGDRYVNAGKSLGNPAGFGMPPVAPDVYEKALAFVTDRAKHQVRLALMCAEGSHKGCHRHTMIGKDLDRRGVSVIHIEQKPDGTIYEVPIRRATQIRDERPASLFG